jgi:prolyl-tRNA editing enzyme YbaK/EbsC (Cys-tRNA(Pro) deacylase)
MQVPDAVARVVAAALARGVEIDVRMHPEGTKTAADAAAAVGCDIRAIVKSLVFVVDGRAVVALVSGDRRLDPARLAAAVGGHEARRATLEEVRAATGFAAGGTPPFGHAEALFVIADPGLLRSDVVWAAAGTPTAVFAIAPGMLVEAAGAVWGDIAVAQRPGPGHNASTRGGGQ